LSGIAGQFSAKKSFHHVSHFLVRIRFNGGRRKRFVFGGDTEKGHRLILNQSMLQPKKEDM